MTIDRNLSEIKFEKWNALGNDFVVIDIAEGELSENELGLLSKKLADRHFGIGCDQVVITRELEGGTLGGGALGGGTLGGGAGVFARFFNADGSESSACGNATRCLAVRYLRNAGLKVGDGAEVLVQTPDRTLACKVLKVGREGYCSVQMGAMKKAAKPSEEVEKACLAALLPIKESLDRQYNNSINLKLYLVDVGNPHLVVQIFKDEKVPNSNTTKTTLLQHRAALEALNIDGVSEEIQGVFPESHGINVEFYFQESLALNSGPAFVRVFERGAGETLACGTGACAVGIAAATTGGSLKSHIIMPGCIHGPSSPEKWHLEERGIIIEATPMGSGSYEVAMSGLCTFAGEGVAFV